MRRYLFLRPSLGLTVAISSLIFGAATIANAAARVDTPPATSSSSNDLEAASTLDLTGLQSQFAKVADSVSPAVVAISASCTPIDSDDVLKTDNLNPQKLDHILNKTTRTVGTGFFVDADGYVLTNEHVICESEQLWVTTDDKKVYPAIVIGTDPRADLAILKIPANHLPIVKFAKPTALHRGEWTIAVGNPYGLKPLRANSR